MRRSMCVGLLAAALGLAGSGAKAANLLKDGSFEKPVVPAGGFRTFVTGQKMGPWTVVGAAGNVALVSGTFAENGFTFPAKSGVQWLDLTGAASNTATGVSQTVATISGGLYDLTFYVGNVVDPGGTFGTTSTVKVFVDGALQMTAVNSKGAGSTKQVWQKFSATVTASTATTAIAFINGDPPSDNECGLDAVSMVPHIAAADKSLEPALFDDK